MSEYPNDIHPEYSFATVYTKDGAVCDYCGNWDTTCTYVHDGYRAVVHAGDQFRTREEYQSAADRELAAAIDCFGEDHRK